jgi:hypothetical protein
MSKSRTKKLRNAFEEKTGFNALHRGSELYKCEWRKFKTKWKRGLL